MVAIAATGDYLPWNGIQYTMSFTKTHFTVDVDPIRKTIVASETPAHQTATSNFDDSGQLAFNAVQSLSLLAIMSSPVLSPILGLTLHNNYRSYMISLQDQRDPNVDYYSKAVSDSFISMMDNILGGYGAAQLYVTKAFKPTDVMGRFAAIRLGEAKVIYVTAGINILLLLLDLVKPRGRDFGTGYRLLITLDTKSVIVAASGGRGDIADKARLRHEAMGQFWSADYGDRLVEKIRVRVKMPDSVGVDGAPMMVLESSGADERLKLRSETTIINVETGIELLSLPTPRELV